MERSRNRSGKQRVKEYGTYHFNGKEWIFYGAIGVGLAILFGSVFYHSVYGMVFMLLMIPFYLKEKRRELCEKRKMQLNLEFKEAITTIAVNLRAGYSVENAMRESYRDCCLLFGKGSLICEELFLIIKGLDNNVTLEVLLQDFGKRSDIDSVGDFAEIFQIAKRTGGNLSRIIQDTVTVICEKAEIHSEIQILLSAKKYEQKIMNIVPILIILYIRTTSPGFFEPLYHNFIGVIIMTICLGLYGTAYFMARKITDIRI